MQIAQIVLEYFKVLSSAQMVIGLLIIVFLLLFKDGLANLIERICNIKLPGGSEISMSQAERAKKESSSKEDRPTEPKKPDFDPTNMTLTPEQVKGLRAVFDAERARAAFWEYEYLNLYLVASTQKVLEWLATLPQPVTVSLADNLWSVLIPQASERRAILQALESHYLVQRKPGDLLEVTPKGHEYLTVRRPRIY